MVVFPFKGVGLVEAEQLARKDYEYCCGGADECADK